MLNTISVLCVNEVSNYDFYPGLDLWKKSRDAKNFVGDNPVITHAPCQQWSRLKKFAKDNPEEKELAFFCWNVVNKNGGIFEHPAGSSFFREVKADMTKVYSVDLFWFGFPARKRTYLYFHNCKPIQLPLRFEAIEKKVPDLHSSSRSDTPHSLIQWMIASINTMAQRPTASNCKGHHNLTLSK